MAHILDHELYCRGDGLTRRPGWIWLRNSRPAASGHRRSDRGEQARVSRSVLRDTTGILRMTYGTGGRCWDVLPTAGAPSIPMPAVFSAYCVPADPQHFQKHFGSIAQWTDAGTFAVGPRHRDFRDFKVELLCQVKQLRIETPAFYVLQRENHGRGPAGESFEAALRVLEIQTQCNAHHQVERAPEKLPIDRLPLRLEVAAQPVRTYGHVRAVRKRG
jgi:hypothetical protein